LQEQLLGEINTEMIIPIPPESFHLTIADLIWEDTYRDAVAKDEKFDEKLRDRIATSFRQYEQKYQNPHPVQLQILGFTLRPRTLSVALLPKSEEAYQKLLHLRRAIYQNPDLIALGIEQQYPYTAHITLGYFGTNPENLDRDRIAKTLDRLNDAELDRDPDLLTLQQAELHKFSDMTHYYRETNFPVVKL
ncbi:MAG: DUF1868 domain-containing protein, partial [Kamptonema sp. SIO4C4]|nr:DUF1868 domain-containing protein [Kamptonema sp. SIO4C4]